jgi:hypothetical protein
VRLTSSAELAAAALAASASEPYEPSAATATRLFGLGCVASLLLLLFGFILDLLLDLHVL